MSDAEFINIPVYGFDKQRKTVVKGFAKVDAADFDGLAVYRWNFVRGYVKTEAPEILGSRRTLLMHRLIMNPGAGQCVDHINGDPADNRRSNLRLCTLSQNAMNSRVPRKRALPRGVIKCNQRFQAKITLNYQMIHIGTYDTIKQAEAARHQAEDAYFGPFAFRRRPMPA